MSKDRYEKCKYPGCIGNIVPGKTMKDLCIKHTDLLVFFVWCLKNVQVQKEGIKDE